MNRNINFLEEKMKKTMLLLLSVFLAALPLFAGGGKQGDGSAGSGPVELVWYVAGSGPQADTPAVLAEVNKYLTEKINCTLKIIETDFGSYTQKMQMVIASQEPFDICYTAHWVNNYYGNISKNAFLELDDLLTRNAPELMALMPANGWEAAKVNGHIYGIPGLQIWAMTNGINIETAYLEKYNIAPSSVKTLEDVGNLMAKIKGDNPNMYPLSVDTGGVLDFLTFVMGYDELAGRHIPGVVLLEDANMKVINQFELPQVQAHYRRMREWNQKGYIRPDAATISEITPELMAGRHPLGFLGTMKPGNDVMEKIRHGGRTVISVPLSASWQTTSGITGSLNSISRTSAHPDKAVQFLNLVNTDKYLYNLITQGIEGKHYTRIDANFIRPVPNSGYTPNADWMYGNQFLAYFKEGQNLTDWDDTMVLNKNAKPSPALGFAFDSVPVQTELASVSAVVKEYELSLSTGAVDPAKVLPEFLEKLKGAGSERIIAEVQKQLDAWKAGK
jgi:putative aldouronate transport system substrate-binding protein